MSGRAVRFRPGHRARLQVFLSQAERLAVHSAPDPSGCRLWTAALTDDGYAIFDQTLAHRVAYQIANGPIPVHLEIDHLCKVRHCVNPDHMEAVPHKINTWRSANTKLSYEIACEVRVAYKEWSGPKSAFCREWAARLGCCQQNVYKIVSGHSWVRPENW